MPIAGKLLKKERKLHDGFAITKNTKKTLSTKQRKRQEQAIQKAENLKELLEEKVKKSINHFEKVVKERKKPWETIK